jgi:hypothetical protein
MKQIKEENIIVVLGDLGAGINFVKNVLLLSPEVDFPFTLAGAKLDFIKRTAYPSELSKRPNQWLENEYKLRYWKKIYGVDIADEFDDLNTPEIAKVTQTKKIIFICHWPNIVNKLKQIYPGLKIVSLYANHEEEVSWQVSMYIEKLGIEKMHNFSFSDNIEQQRTNYINKHGEQAYQKFNALNMYEIMLERKDTYYDPSYYIINIGQLQTDVWIEELTKKLELELDLEQAKDLSAGWRSINPTTTKQWSNQ